MKEKRLYFNIKKLSHIVNMNIKCSNLEISQELIYIATELADNMLKAKTVGAIEIFPEKNLVINTINGNRTAYKELYMFFSVAKYVFNNRSELFPSTNSEYTSRGFLSMFYSNWLLDVVQHTSNEYEIIARKNK
jgi:hypothetical protein